AAYLLELTDYLCQELEGSSYEVVSSRQDSEKSQIVCIRHRGGVDPMSLYTHLRRQNIITAPRGGRLRISPHFYNTTDEIDRLVHFLP
ncbi:MAG TPA: hypothetical protein VJ180_04245, partial [Pyrinomonadaceae bacterium]|nr:hypothetical protein [Pyrinomonadaceae bacterium]